jgi:hypothetical protein
MESKSLCFKEYVLSDVKILSGGQVGRYYNSLGTDVSGDVSHSH